MKRLSNKVLNNKTINFNQFTCFTRNESERYHINFTSVSVAVLSSMRLFVLLIGLGLHGVVCQNGPDDGQEDETVKEVTPEEQQEIEDMVKTNSHLQQNISDLKKDCNANYQVHWNVYYELIKKVQIQPGGDVLHKNETVKYDRGEKLEKAIKQMKYYTRVLILKRDILHEDVKLLNRRQDEYQQCTEFAPQINFKPVKTVSIGTRSIKRKRTHSKSHHKSSAISQERKMLRIKKEYELYRNEELKTYKVYYAGFCSRRLKNIQKLIDQLSKYPEAVDIDELKRHHIHISHLVDEKEEELKSDELNFHKTVRDIHELQAKYDSMINVATCFKKLNKWHVGKYMDKFDKFILSKIKKSNMKNPRELTGRDHHPFTEVKLGQGHH